MGLNWLNRLESGLQGSKNTNIIQNEVNDERREKRKNAEFENLFKNNHTIKKPANRFPIEARRQADTTERDPRSDPLPKHGTKRARETDRKGTLGKSRQDDRKLFCIPRCDNIQKRINRSK